MASFGLEVPKAMKPLLEDAGMSEKQFIAWGQAVAAGGDAGAKAMSDVATWLDTIDNKELKFELAKKVFGTKFEDQGQNMISVFQGVSDAADKTGENIAKLDEKTEQLDADPITQLQQAFGEMKMALEPVLSVIADVISKTAEWISNNPTLAATIAAIASVIGILVGACMALAPVFMAVIASATPLAASIGSIALPVAGVVAAIAGLVAGFIHLYQTNTEFRNQVQVIWTSIKETISAAMTAIKAIFDLLWPAIKMLIESTWQAIQNVIKGALDVIQGVIKTFSSLFQGDWQGVWDGIKQILSGALQAIWGAINLYFVSKLLAPLKGFAAQGKTIIQNVWNAIKSIFTNTLNAIKSITTTVFNSIKSVITTIWNAIKSFFSSVLNSIKSIFSTIWNAIKSTITSVTNGIKSVITTVWNAIKSTITSVMNAIKSVISSVWNACKSVVTSAVNAIKSIVSSVFNSLKSVVSKAMNGVKSAIETGWNKAKSFLEGISLIQIGKDIIRGLVSGINSMFDSVRSKISELASLIPSWAKKMLGIKSPSRVMRDEVGIHVGTGMAAGIDKSAKYVKNSTSRLAKSTSDSAKKTLDNLKKKFNSEMQNLSLKFKAEKIDITQYISSFNRMKKEYAKVPNAIAKIDAQIVSLRKKYSKEMFDYEKAQIDEKKYYNELSLEEELKAWQKINTQYKKGTNERKEAEKEIYRLKNEINSKLLDLNDEYINKIVESNKKLADGIKSLKENYEKEVSSLTKTIYQSMGGIFDEFKYDTEVTGKQLLANLESQVTAMKDWQYNMKALTARGMDKDLLAELTDLGVKAAPQIAALTELTNDELNQYVSIWKEKNKLAKEQALSQLSDLQLQTQVQIENLRKEVAAELKLYEKEWITKVKEIKTGTTNEFVGLTASMKTIGRNSIKGLMNGLNEMVPPLKERAEQIANSVSSTIKKVLDINSPSRVLMELGSFAGEGLVIGLEKMKKLVVKASELLAQSAIPEVKLGDNIRRNEQFIQENLALTIPQQQYVVVQPNIFLDGQEIANVQEPYLNNMLSNQTISKLYTKGVRR